MGSESINLSLENIYKSWFLFRKGKKTTEELDKFQYFLEDNLRRLQVDLISGHWHHGGYREFTVVDNKRRKIRVAGVRDRVVHRLVYEYLKPIFDKAFIYDAWSCRDNKGLIGAVKRTQKFLRLNRDGFVWRADVKKFFDNVDRKVLLSLIERRIFDYRAIRIIREIIFGGNKYERERESKDNRGIPIGNLTSQIFANIYLNELDRFVKHDLRIKYYLRYGDDFIIFAGNIEELLKIRQTTASFLNQKLKLEMNVKNDIIIKTKQGLKFLGATILPDGRRLNKRNWRRLKQKINFKNIASYDGLVKQYEPGKRKELNWLAVDLLDNF